MDRNQDSIGLGKCSKCKHEAYHVFYSESVKNNKKLQCPECENYSVEIKSMTRLTDDINL